MDPFHNLLTQIDAFIRKYYKNEMLKGGILFLGLLLFSFLLITLLEYFGRFSSTVRGVFFFGFILLNVVLFVKYLLIPLSKLVSFGKRINRYQAATIIGTFFPEISDRLLNTLQLNDVSDQSSNYELIRASVMQRSKSLTVVPFSSGIDFKKNMIYVKYVLPVALVFLLIAFIFPNVLKQGSERVVNYRQEFKPEAPFQFLLNSSLTEIEEGQDYTVDLKLKGADLPQNVYLVSSQGKFLMNKSSKIESFYVLRRLKENTTFYFEGNGFVSKTYTLKVIPKSIIGRFEARLNYPAYLGRTNEVIANVADIEIPEGTDVEWIISAKNANKIDVNWTDSKTAYDKESFKFSKKFSHSDQLLIVLHNQLSKSKDSSRYQINVIKDEFPTITVRESLDTISSAIRFFDGSISDDYGLTSLYFVYKITKESGAETTQKVSVIKTFGTTMNFSHAVDFRRENLSLKDKIEYYFVVSDNDGVNGSKSSKSSIFTYQLPTLEELNEKRDEDQASNKKELDDVIKKAAEFQKNIQKLKKEMMNSKSADWDKMNKLNQLKEEQNSLEKALEQLQMKMNESLQEKNQLSELDKELLQKQDLLQKLLDEVMDDELKDLLKQLEDLMKTPDKNSINDKLEKLDNKSEDMKKQLDRSLELLKKMQVNEKIDDIEKSLQQLAKEQLDLKKQTEEKALPKEELIKKQKEIDNKFEQVKDDLNKLKDMNEQLDRPMNLGDQEDLKKEVSEDLKSSEESLDKGKNSKAGDSQKSAAEKMEKIAKELEQMQEGANAEQDEEDMTMIRMILKNLMTLSFNQEDTFTQFGRTRTNDPYFRALGRKQRTLMDDSKIVADSLQALAKRQPQISSFIDKELSDIKQNFDLSIKDIGNRDQRFLQIHLQSAMTSFNNLALMLNESLQDMQSKSQMKGDGACDKPGGKGGKPNDGKEAGDMKEMLKKQLEQMKKGQKPGGNSPGQEGKDGSSPLPGMGNKEISKMVAEQTAIRQRLEQLRNEMNKDGKGQGNSLNPLINELEKQEKDLLNKKFNKEMLNRQQDILTRLLESEKALLERGFEEKRESKSGKDFNLSNQKRIDEYNQQKLKQIEMIRTVNPMYRKYYKDKASEYFNAVL